MSVKDIAFIAAQYLLPHHALSRLAGWFAESELNWIKRPLMRFFLRRFGIDLTEAERENIEDYRNFNDFFTRALKSDARVLDDNDTHWISPVDAAVSQFGTTTEGRLVQAKQKSFSVQALLGGDAGMAKRYANGEFITLYLSPKDYHRIHMPASARLLRTTFVPGRLFSVNPLTANHVDNLFARNERLVCEFDSDRGRFVMVLVGAMVVASIETTWSGIVAPFQRRIQQHDFNTHAIDFRQGEEMGRFRLGSTVIMLFEPGQMTWADQIKKGASVQLGQPLDHTI